jgi:hypothetical protein
MPRQPQALIEILKAGARTTGLLQQAQENSRRTEQLRELLPGPIALHLRATSWDRGRLVLFADSPVWASRLRFASPALLRVLSGVRDIRVRVLPASGSEPDPCISSAHRPRLSATTAQTIRRAAAGVDDPALRTALSRLADRATSD